MIDELFSLRLRAEHLVAGQMVWLRRKEPTSRSNQNPLNHRFILLQREAHRAIPDTGPSSFCVETKLIILLLMPVGFGHAVRSRSGLSTCP